MEQLSTCSAENCRSYVSLDWAPAKIGSPCAPYAIRYICVPGLSSENSLSTVNTDGEVLKIRRLCRRQGRKTSSSPACNFVRRYATSSALSGTNTACCSSRAFATPLRQPSAMDCDAGSGKISSSPFPGHRRWNRDRLGRGLRKIDASGHIGINRSRQDGMNRHALAG